jgi:FAD/FMN-containing dehydrogenase
MSGSDVRQRLFCPSCVASDEGGTVTVLLEGHADDVAEQLVASGCTPIGDHPHQGPARPTGAWRGRISVPVTSLRSTVEALGRRVQNGLGPDGQGAHGLGAISTVAWLAEWGVGTIHVGAGSPEALLAARAVAHAHGGWLLREAGPLDLDGTVADDGFGVGLPNAEIQRRLKAAFDPSGRLNPGRIPL